MERVIVLKGHFWDRYATGFNVTEANWKVFNNAVTIAEVVLVYDDKISEVNWICK